MSGEVLTEGVTEGSPRMNTPTPLRGPRLASTLNGPRRVLQYEVDAQADTVRHMFRLYRDEQTCADPSSWVIHTIRTRLNLAARLRREHLQALRILEAHA